MAQFCADCGYCYTSRLQERIPPTPPFHLSGIKQETFSVRISALSKCNVIPILGSGDKQWGVRLHDLAWTIPRPGENRSGYIKPDLLVWVGGWIAKLFAFVASIRIMGCSTCTTNGICAVTILMQSSFICYQAPPAKWDRWLWEREGSLA